MGWCFQVGSLFLFVEGNRSFFEGEATANECFFFGGAMSRGAQPKKKPSITGATFLVNLVRQWPYASSQGNNTRHTYIYI